MRRTYFWIILLSGAILGVIGQWLITSDFFSLLHSPVPEKIIAGYSATVDRTDTVKAAAAQTAIDYTPDETINIRVYKEVSPGVVNITSRVVEYDFFLQAVMREGGSGSGSIIDKQGNIVTNYHVIAEAEQLEVTLPDQSKWKATVRGADPLNDLAVIKINAPTEKLHPVRFGDSTKLMVGQKALAIGNPFQLHNTLTIGIISSLGRTIKDGQGNQYNDIMQTDAGLNPGNSGGPLLNSAGEMIGVNTLIFSPSGANAGLGFAIPVSKVKRIVNDLLKYGQVRRPYFGLSSAYNITPDIAELFELPVKQGILIVQVVPGSPAYQAGIRGGRQRVRVGNRVVYLGGDILVSVDGRKIESYDTLFDLLNDNYLPGQEATFGVIRDGMQRSFKVVLGEPPPSMYGQH